MLCESMEDTALKNHAIVCGYGLVGERIIDTLVQYGIPCVVIEIDPKRAEQLRSRGITAIEGDATASKTLKEAGIATAKVIAVAMDNDAKNLLCVITAKSLNPRVVIATRANDEFIKEKLSDAGADYIATPAKSATNELFKELAKGL